MNEQETDEKREASGSNRLARELSPYLRQHARNPVDWYPWGDEAFARARAEEKPIFLSVGYSTCHWCHVMERESFSDPDVAALLNEHFVSIKVDREERPDIDTLYMHAAIALTGSGGWPLNIVLTPDLQPFYAAAYLPKNRRGGLPGLMEILPELARYWRENREKVVESAGLLARSIIDSQHIRAGSRVGRGAAERMTEDLILRYDSLNGGFGPAPKFPMPHLHLFLLRYWKWTGNEKARRMAENTLLSMANGGIYDHLGRGFHRYSTDARWFVPHFEKMLYDQALAATAYTEAFLATKNREFGDVARGCMEYTCRELAAPGGGFYSAEDADSEGEEGKYYLWTRDEIASLLEPEDARVAFLVYPVSKNGNFFDPAAGGYSGQNILHRTHSPKKAAHVLSMDLPQVNERLERIRLTLLKARGQREKPFRDEKILADWNGLAIGSLAMVSRALGTGEFMDAAKKAVSFILSRMRMDDGGLYHRWMDNAAGVAGISADYAAMIHGLLEVYIASGDPRCLESALDLEELHVERFWDNTEGGYFSAPESAKDLFSRQKEFTDGAIPSPNSLSFANLVRLGLLTGDDDFTRRAELLSRMYSPILARSPGSCGMFMAAYTLSAGPASRVVLTGERSEHTFREMQSLLDHHYLPFTLPLSMGSDEERDALMRLAPFTRTYAATEGAATAYICTGKSCQAPVHTAGELADLLGISPG